jgi:hypothetical protein
VEASALAQKLATSNRRRSVVLQRSPSIGERYWYFC